MRPRAILLLAACVVAPQLLHAQGTDKLTARSELRRRYVLIAGEGTLASVPSGGAVTARIRRPGLPETALATSITVGAGGAVSIELRTTKRLLPDTYELEILDGTNPPADAKALAAARFAVGSPAEVAAARETLRAWLVSQRGALRDLTAALERSGAYHRNQLLVPLVTAGAQPGRALVTAQSAAWRRALEAFEERYRVARMDFGLYEREVLLTPFPNATRALSDVFAAYRTRQRELEGLVFEAAAGRKPLVPPASAILGIARTSALELGLVPDEADWGEGPLGAPESPWALDKGVLTTALGATLAVPTSFTAVNLALKEGDRPDLRFTATAPVGGENAVVELFVRELPDIATFGDDIEALVEMLTWEEYGNNSWKKMATAKAPRRQQLEGRWLLGNRPFRLVVVIVAPRSGKRLFELRAWCPEPIWDKCRAEFAQIAASFGLNEK